MGGQALEILKKKRVPQRRKKGLLKERDEDLRNWWEEYI